MDYFGKIPPRSYSHTAQKAYIMEFKDIQSLVLAEFLVGGAFTVFFVCAAALVFMLLAHESVLAHEKGGKKLIVPTVALMVVLLSATLYAKNHRDTMIESNREILASNILKKYSVDEVVLDDETAWIDPNEVERQDIHVVVEGKTYVFVLTQDPETWEPKLSDPPIPGGISPSTALSAEDLLK